MTTGVGIFFDPTEGVYMKEGDGPLQTKKYLDIEDVRDLLLSNVSLDTGLLPKGCSFYLRQDGKTIIVLEQAPTIRRVLYRRGREILEYDVPTPNTIMGLLFEGGVLRQSYCNTSKFPISSLETELFHFPFGNVFQDSRICWGNAEVPPVRNMVEASQIPMLFYEAPFNGDLAEGAYNYEGDLRDYLSHLNGREHFPLDTLVRMGVSSVNELIHSLKRDAGLI